LAVDPGSEAAWLARVPVGSLPGIGPVAQAALAGIGVEHAGQLPMVPRTRLESVVGVERARLWRSWADGTVADSPEWRGDVFDRDREPLSLSVERTLPVDAHRVDDLEPVLVALAAELSGRLLAAGAAPHSLEVKVRST